MRRVAGGAFALAVAVGLVAYPVTAASPSVADLATRAGLLRLTITADRRAGTIDSQGVADSLTAKLAVVTATATTNAKTAANGLAAFSHAVAAQRGNHISTAAADDLTRIASGNIAASATIAPGTAGVVSTVTNTNPVAIEVPAGTTVAQVAVTPAATAIPIQPPAAYKAAAAVVISATSTSGQPVTSFASSPLTISLGFRPPVRTLAAKAEVDTIDPLTSATQRLPTTVTANADGSYTATAPTTHLTPFVVDVPDAAGTIATILGGPETGQSTSVGQDPAGVAVTSAGGVLVADAANNVIRVVDPSSRYESVLAGTGEPGGFGDGGPAAAAQFNVVRGVAVDDVTGTVAVADWGNQEVRSISPDGATVTKLVEGVSAAAVAAHNGVVYVADQSLPGVVAVARDGSSSVVLHDGGVPTGLAADVDGNLFVSESGPDTDGGRLVEVGADGTTTSLLSTAPLDGAALGQAPDATPTGPLTGVAVDGAGDLFFSESTYSRVFEMNRFAAQTMVLAVASAAASPSSTPSSTIPPAAAPPGPQYEAPTVIAGSGTAGYNDDPTNATNAALSNPGQLAYASGVLYVADAGNNRVRSVNLINGGMATFAGRDGTSMALGNAPDAPLVLPAAVAYDPTRSRTYVADNGSGAINSVIYQVDAGGAVHQLQLSGINSGIDEIRWRQNGARPPAMLTSRIVDLAVDGTGRVVIADRGRGLILRYDPASCDATSTVCPTATLAGPGEHIVSAQDSTAGGPGSNVYRWLRGISVDSRGTVWAADDGDPTNGTLFTVSPANALSTAATGLADPVSVTADSAGGAYVALAGSNSVAHVTPTQQTVVAGAPSGLLRTDGQGRLLVNTGTVVVRVDNGTATAVAGNGTTGFSGDNGPAINASFNDSVFVGTDVTDEVGGMATDAAGDLLVADTNNARLRMVVAGY